MKTLREKFYELLGEYPEDMFGPDWENYIDDWWEEFKEDLRSDKFGREYEQN